MISLIFLELLCFWIWYRI